MQKVKRRELKPRTSLYIFLLIVVMIIAFLLRLNNLDIPSKKIGDEVYYVPVALEILGIETSGVNPYLGQSHTPLGKMIIAVGIYLFGDNPLGWRIMSVIFGTLMIPIFYLLVISLLRDRPDKHLVGLLAVFFLSFENLTFYFSRVARIDIFMLFFLVLGVFFMVTKIKWRWLAAGLSFSLSFLSKEAALVCILPILLWATFLILPSEEKTVKPKKKKEKQVVQKRRFDKQRFKEGILLGLVFASSSILLWYFFEWVILEPKSKDIFTRISNMISRLNITNPNAPGRSEPWQWLINQPPAKAIGLVSGSKLDIKSLSPVGPLFNPEITYAYWIQISWPLLIVTIPTVIYAVAHFRKDNVARLCATWWLGSYLIWIIIRLFYRSLTYLFYYLPLTPPIVICLSYVLGGHVYKELSQGLKSKGWTTFTAIYVLSYLFYFFYLYPVPIS